MSFLAATALFVLSFFLSSFVPTIPRISVGVFLDCRRCTMSFIILLHSSSSLVPSPSLLPSPPCHLSSPVSPPSLIPRSCTPATFLHLHLPPFCLSPLLIYTVRLSLPLFLLPPNLTPFHPISPSLYHLTSLLCTSSSSLILHLSSSSPSIHLCRSLYSEKRDLLPR